MSELWGPGEQLGLLVRASALGRRGWICWPKRQNCLPVLWRGEPEPVAVCSSGEPLGQGWHVAAILCGQPVTE